jgi:HK97 family phage major capsid protein
MSNQSQWLGSVDPQRRQAFERALNVAGAGSVLLQTFINRTVQQLHLRELGASAVLPRRPGQGDAAYINRRTPGISADWVADTDAITEGTGTYAQTSFAYKTLGTRGRVTRKLQATGRSYGDVLAGEIAGKSGDWSETYENGLIVGDSGTDPNQFDGLLTLIGATASQVVAQSTAPAGDALTLEKLDETIDVVKGSAARSDLVILASFRGRRLLNAALQAQQQFNDMIEIAAGFRVRTYDGIPIVTTTEMPDVLTWSGSAITSFSGASTTAIAVVNTRYCWIEELTPMTVMPLAKSDSQFDEFDIFSDSALVMANTLGAAILGGITTA